MPASATKAGFWRRRRTWLVTMPACVLVMAGLFAVLCWWLARSSPSWYQPMAMDDPRLEQLALNFQYHYQEINNAVQRVPMGDQTITIRDSELTAFLETNTRIAQEGPAGKVGQPVIYFAKDHVTIAIQASRIPGGGAEGGVLTATYAVKMSDAPAGDADQHRRMRITLEQAWLGKLRIPTAMIESHKAELRAALLKAMHNIPMTSVQALGDQGGPGGGGSADFHELVTHGLDGDVFVPAFTVPKKRAMVVKDLQIKDGELTITIGLK